MLLPHVVPRASPTISDRQLTLSMSLLWRPPHHSTAPPPFITSTTTVFMCRLKRFFRADGWPARTQGSGKIVIFACGCLCRPHRKIKIRKKINFQKTQTLTLDPASHRCAGHHRRRIRARDCRHRQIRAGADAAAGSDHGEGGAAPGRRLAIVVVVSRAHAAGRRLLPLLVAALPSSSSSRARHFRPPLRRHRRRRARCSWPPPRETANMRLVALALPRATGHVSHAERRRRTAHTVLFFSFRAYGFLFLFCLFFSSVPFPVFFFSFFSSRIFFLFFPFLVRMYANFVYVHI